jgi:hypothetical protein
MRIERRILESREAVFKSEIRIPQFNQAILTFPAKSSRSEKSVDNRKPLARILVPLAAPGETDP